MSVINHNLTYFLRLMLKAALEDVTILELLEESIHCPLVEHLGNGKQCYSKIHKYWWGHLKCSRQSAGCWTVPWMDHPRSLWKKWPFKRPLTNSQPYIHSNTFHYTLSSSRSETVFSICVCLHDPARGWHKFRAQEVSVECNRRMNGTAFSHQLRQARTVAASHFSWFLSL